ncbi:DUF6263 family protein [Polaribacter sp. Hel_I_88]|uniref:DUF6263 family protein n=1 Tax=Polaribacter sp. Hel_I_88 TaxID=1250006 RepID=UPI000479ABE9|nr:DUF6263 family protein [Polaribacter sp. Hel_I_88]
MKKLILLLFVITANISLAQETALLRLNYEKGAAYDVSMNVSQEMGAIMSMGMNINMTSKITDVEGDTYDSEMKFTKLTMDMLQGGNAMSFDSTKSDEELDAVGKQMKTQMQPMLEALMFAKGNNLGEIIDIKIEPNVMGMEDIVKQSSSVVYPKEAVKVGDSWTMTKEEKGMKMDFVYTVKSIDKDNVNLVISGDVSGMATGKIAGNMQIDAVSGVPMSSIVTMLMNINGQEMTTKVTMETTKK